MCNFLLKFIICYKGSNFNYFLGVNIPSYATGVELKILKMTVSYLHLPLKQKNLF
jgi:hypothetical protein